MRDRSDAALEVWAPTADALARGEQIFELLPDGGDDLRELEHEEFWILPGWDGDARRLTEPYQDRLRALLDLRHDDGRIRLGYYATAEYLEGLQGPGDLRALDGDHTLSASGVRSLFEEADGRVSLLVLRVRERAEAVVLPADSVAGLTGRWRSLAEPLPLDETGPVVPEDRFLSRKARLLQRTGMLRAV